MTLSRPPFVTLRRFNHLLTVVVIGLALFIVLTPFIPGLAWWLKHQAPIISKPPSISVNDETIPQQSTLVIPKLGLQETIYEGATKQALKSGIWHRPSTGNPLAGGNTVLAGHRFTYRDPAVFYHLDKVTVGDVMTVYWQKQRYDYKVTSIKTVAPTAVEIENPTKEPTLTIYTCTPVWSSKYRLAIIAKPVEAL